MPKLDGRSSVTGPDQSLPSLALGQFNAKPPSTQVNTPAILTLTSTPTLSVRRTAEGPRHGWQGGHAIKPSTQQPGDSTTESRRGSQHRPYTRKFRTPPHAGH